MTIASSRRVRPIAAAIAALLALIAPLVGTAPANATAGYVGVATGDTWVDSSLALMSQGVSYSSTLTVPSSNGPWENLVGHNLPTGLGYSFDGTTVTVSGTPTAGGTADTFSFDADGGDGAHTLLTFSSVYITPSVPAATVTLVSNVQAAPYTGVNFTATVTGTSPTGSVDFKLGSTTIGTGTLSGGVATFTGAVDSSYVGHAIDVTATYNGDASNGSATSDEASEYIYRSATVSGTVTRNGFALSTTVQLVLPGSLTVVAETTSTGGAYSFTIDGIDTLEEATNQYLIRAQGTGIKIYYSADGGPGIANQGVTDADITSPLTWGSGFTIYENIAPIWTDTTLAIPRVGSTYSDYVAASAGVATKHYTVTAGTLPPGLTLGELTGLISGTPTNEDSHTFTITVNNGYGTVTHEFTLKPLAAGVPPTWTDTAIGDLAVGTVVDDAVAAEGDPTITYSVSSGTLPSGLALDGATGAVTGTPTVDGEFEFTLTATNDFGHVDEPYTVTVAALPELHLELAFAPGTSIDDASTQISADGLKVGSTYTLDLHSSPIRLYTGIVDSSGGFTWLVTLPADTPVGAHELILTGIAPDGSVLTAHAWFTLRADGTVGAVSYTGPFALAFTGVQPILPLGVASLLLIGGFLAMRRAASLRAGLAPSPSSPRGSGRSPRASRTRAAGGSSPLPR